MHRLDLGREFSNEYSVAKSGVDTAERERALQSVPALRVRIIIFMDPRGPHDRGAAPAAREPLLRRGAEEGAALHIRRLGRDEAAQR